MNLRTVYFLLGELGWLNWSWRDGDMLRRERVNLKSKA